MKKTKFYQLFISLLCLFLMGITFSSCEVEKDFAIDNKIIVKKCSMKDIKLSSDMKLNHAVNYLKSLQTKSLLENPNARFSYDEELGIYYDDEKGVYMSKDGKESYTFPVIQTEDTEKIKNIVFNKNSNNEYDIYITKYDFTKEDMANYTKEALAQREIKYQALLKNGVKYTIEAQWILCFYTEALIAIPIDNGELTGNFGYELTWVTISSACFSSVDTGNSGGASIGNGNNNGNETNNSQGGTIITGAVVDNDAILPQLSEHPCKDMADLSKPNSGDIKPEIDWLKTKLDETKEFGVEVEKSPNPNSDGNYNYTKTEKESNENDHVELSFGGYVIGAAHSHPANLTYAIPSYGDLKWLEICISHVPSFRKQDVFTIIICKDAEGVVSTYAIKITNLLSFTTKINAIWNNSDYAGFSEKQKLDEIHKKQVKKYKNTNNQTNLLEKIFLEEFAGFGIDILKATNNNYDNWETLKLDSSQTSGVKSVTCSNN